MSTYRKINGLQRRILRETILETFSREEFDILLSDEFDTRLSGVAGSGTLVAQVFEVINWAQREAKIDPLISAVIDRRPHAGRSLTFAAPAAAPVFVGAQPQPRPTGLDASSLERLVRGGEGIDRYGPMLDRFLALQGQVCRIECATLGTGFLVAPDLVLTNFHVVEQELKAGAPGEDILCRFDFLSESSRGVPVRLASSQWCIAHAPYAPSDARIGGRLPTTSELDYALLRLGNPVANDAKGRARGSIAVSASAKVPEAQRILFIAQHPESAPLSSSWGLSCGLANDDLRFRYTAETLGGSSGSPVFDGDLSLVALHHAGEPGSKLAPGDYNQGVPIARIVADLARKSIQRFWE